MGNSPIWSLKRKAHRRSRAPAPHCVSCLAELPAVCSYLIAPGTPIALFALQKDFDKSSGSSEHTTPAWRSKFASFPCQAACCPMPLGKDQKPRWEQSPYIPREWSGAAGAQHSPTVPGEEGTTVPSPWLEASSTSPSRD